MTSEHSARQDVPGILLRDFPCRIPEVMGHLTLASLPLDRSTSQEDAGQHSRKPLLGQTLKAKPEEGRHSAQYSR